MFSRDNSLSSSYRTASFSNSRESSSNGSTESSCFRDSDSTQRASSVYNRYIGCAGEEREPDYLNLKIPRIWSSETCEILNSRPSDVSSSSDEKSSSRSSSYSLSDLIAEDCNFEDAPEDYYENTGPQLDEEALVSCHRQEEFTPVTAPLSPTSTSGQNSPARFSPVNTPVKRTFLSSLFRPKPS